ncbi:MAG: S8 family peptidase [Candidatus Eisenbacteria bacterium]
MSKRVPPLCTVMPRLCSRTWVMVAAVAAITLFAFDAKAATGTGTLLDAAHDVRVDSFLKAILEQADANSVRGLTMAALAARSTTEEVTAPEPLSANYVNALPDSPIDLFLEGPVDRAALEALGVEVNTQAGGMTTARAPLGLIPTLLTAPGLTRVSAAAPVYPMLDVSTLEIDADAVWGAKPPVFTGSSGKGVVVGIIDTGLDTTHPDFRDVQNKTRVKYAWNQSALGNKPPGFTYGAEFTSADIDAGTAVINDSDGHGTHVTGIAAGNGRATGNAQPAYQYVGVAPEADLVIVQITPIESALVDAVNWIFQKAAQMGKKAVINMSWSSGYGPRDGSSSLDAGISALTGPGKLVSASVGNYGNIPVHGRCNITSTNQSASVQFVIPTYTPSPLDVEYVGIEGWHDLGGIFDVKLTSPTGITTSVISTGGSIDQSTTDGRIILENDIQVTPKAKRILAYVRELDPNVPKAGTWTITVTRKSGSSTGVIDFWVATWRLGTTTSPSFTGTALDQTRTLTSPSTADSVIAAGAYSTKVRWTNGTGGTSLYSGNPIVGQIANFSSQGPRRDGLQRPDVVAPGYGVSAALSSTVAPYTSTTWMMPDQVHRIRYGTSAAAAHVTGALALMLQTDPNLTPSKARLALQRQARTDSFTGSVPNVSYGWGKLDLISGGATGVDAAAIERFAFAAPFPNPSSARSLFQFSIPAEDLAHVQNRLALDLVDVRGRLVASLPVAQSLEVQRLSWNGLAIDGTKAAPGVYFARLTVNDRVAVRKFVRIED